MTAWDAGNGNDMTTAVVHHVAAVNSNGTLTKGLSVAGQMTMSVSPRATATATSHRKNAASNGSARLRADKESGTSPDQNGDANGNGSGAGDGDTTPRLTTIPPSTSASQLPALTSIGNGHGTLMNTPLLTTTPAAPTTPVAAPVVATTPAPLTAAEKRRLSLVQSMRKLTILTVLMDLVVIAIVAIVGSDNLTVLSSDTKAHGPPVAADPNNWVLMNNMIVYVQWLTIYVMIWYDISFVHHMHASMPSISHMCSYVMVWLISSIIGIHGYRSIFVAVVRSGTICVQVV